MTKTKRLEQICHHFPNHTIKAMMTKLREFEREKRENCEIKMRENEEKPEEKLNFDNYEEAKLKRGIKCKKEVKPIVIENKD